MLTLTPSAQRALNRFIKGAEKPVAGLRISVTGKDCSGMQYGMSLEDEVRLDDLLVECAGFRILVDPVSAPLLKGVTVDFHDSMDGSGFRFENPNAAARRGCGKSVSA